jgi:hypothetical protein
MCCAFIQPTACCHYSNILSNVLCCSIKTALVSPDNRTFSLIIIRDFAVHAGHCHTHHHFAGMTVLGTLMGQHWKKGDCLMQLFKLITPKAWGPLLDPEAAFQNKSPGPQEGGGGVTNSNILEASASTAGFLAWPVCVAGGSRCRSSGTLSELLQSEL